jgi:antirestriction protein ArdC
MLCNLFTLFVRRPLGDRDYSEEELRAEIGSAFLCGHTGIVDKTLDSSASYLDSWLSRLNKDNRLIVYAASRARAQRAANHILTVTLKLSTI